MLGEKIVLNKIFILWYNRLKKKDLLVSTMLKKNRTMVKSPYPSKEMN